jgi:anaerobic magnesium-protoporphyrin IX monomethyl ester cyclase
MKKIVLINPPQANSLDDHLDPPLGLMYIASNLERYNIKPRIVDLSGKPKNEWANLIGNADIMGITIFTASFNVSRKIAGLTKKLNPNVHVIAGGPHPTSLPEQTLSCPEFDTVVTGEGEEEMVKIVDSYYSGIKIPRLINAAKLIDLDSFPPPARHLVDLKNYHRHVEGRNATTMITSRGCPYSCVFCCRDVHGNKVRLHSINRIIDELNDIKNTYGIDSVLFYDDVFTMNVRGRLEELCKRIKPLNFTFRCNGRVGMNKPGDYVLLKEAGCDEIAFGIESGSQRILDAMGKRVTVEQNRKTLEEAKAAGLKTKAYLMVGFPGETEETVEETKRFIETADPDKFTLFAFVPLPGCDVWRNPKKYGVIHLSHDWDQYFNIAGNYEGGLTFETESLSNKRFLALHDDLVKFLLAKGQRGTLERYYSDLKT